MIIFFLVEEISLRILAHSFSWVVEFSGNDQKAEPYMNIKVLDLTKGHA